MKKFRMYPFYVLLTILGFISCSTYDDMNYSNTDEQNVTRVVLTVERNNYDDAQITRTAESNGWQNNDTVYVRFIVSTGNVDGKLVYDASEHDWSLSYNGSISGLGRCEAYFFEGDYNVYGETIELSHHTAIYQDTNGTFSKEGGILRIKLNLSPKLGRLRLNGTPEDVVTLYGLSYFETFDVNTKSFKLNHVFSRKEDESFPLHMQIEADGYTPYVYASTVGLELFKNGKLYATNRTLPVGKSVRIMVPSETNHNEWKMTDDYYCCIDNVLFQMVKVDGGTFLMGTLDKTQTNKYPTVTLSDYYIGEIEVTRALWEKVIGNSPSTSKDQRYPAYDVTWGECKEFTKRLSAMTGKKFRLPTEAEWEFAARGGNASQGYRYSGSDDLHQVAQIHRGCLYSTYQNRIHPDAYYVGEMRSNELGIYDMTGSVNEWCSDWYDEYPTGSVVNPQGPLVGTMRVIRGYYTLTGVADEIGGGMSAFARSDSIHCICHMANDGEFILKGLRIVMEP